MPLRYKCERVVSRVFSTVFNGSVLALEHGQSGERPEDGNGKSCV